LIQKKFNGLERRVKEEEFLVDVLRQEKRLF